MNPRLLTTLMVLMLLTGCAPSETRIRISSTDECIQPEYNSLPVTAQDSTSATPKQIPPQGKWKIQTALPFSQDRIINYLGIRPKEYELWFKDSNSQKIYRYFIKEGQWKTYTTLDWTMDVPDNLYIAHDGTVWSAGIKFESQISADETRPLLSRFDDSTDRFEAVKDTSAFLQAPNVRLVSNIAEDLEGALWFFVEDYPQQILTSFDVNTGQVEQHYSMETGGNTNLTIGSNGSIWFIDRFDDQIIQYNPSLKVTHTYGNSESMNLDRYPLDMEKVHYLYFDDLQRLWLANRAWLDFSQSEDPIWHRIPESPVFFGKSGIPRDGYGLLPTYSMYQSSNGLYWFTGGTGIVRLDLQAQTWCLMTTGISEVVEDNDHNLWIAVFGHVYKYSLEP